MNIFNKVSKKALEIGLTKYDVEFKKEPFNGIQVIELNKDKKKELQELKKYIFSQEIKHLGKVDIIIPKLAINQIDL